MSEADLKLVNLQPRLLHPGHPFDASSWHEIAFLCPKCRKHEITVAFWDRTPSDRVQVGENELGPIIVRMWQRHGLADFGCLTLTPSINREGLGDKCGGWHGFIANGEVQQ